MTMIEIGAEAMERVIRQLGEIRDRCEALLDELGVDGKQDPKVFEIGDCVLDMGAFQLTRDGEVLKLEPAAVKMLACLAANRGHMCTRKDLYYAAHGEVMGPMNRSVDANISNIRRAVEPVLREQNIIVSVRGYGYRMSGIGCVVGGAGAKIAP